jgi:hypothetical protein
MSIHHQFVLTCDQNPLPNRCEQVIRIRANPDLPMARVNEILAEHDWGIVDVHGKKAHYCPYHRPVR